MMDARRESAEEFFGTILEDDEHPLFVSDVACVYDIWIGEDRDLIAKCQLHYGVRLEEAHLRLPLWKLLDYLESHRRRPSERKPH